MRGWRGEREARDHPVSLLNHKYLTNQTNKRDQAEHEGRAYFTLERSATILASDPSEKFTTKTEGAVGSNFS